MDKDTLKRRFIEQKTERGMTPLERQGNAERTRAAQPCTPAWAACALVPTSPHMHAPLCLHTLMPTP
eukprot:18114-Chlamydomonas_euryale.AAC.1